MATPVERRTPVPSAAPTSPHPGTRRPTAAGHRAPARPQRRQGWPTPRPPPCSSPCSSWSRAAGRPDVAVATGACSPATAASTPPRTTPTPSATGCSGRPSWFTLMYTDRHHRHPARPRARPGPAGPGVRPAGTRLPPHRLPGAQRPRPGLGVPAVLRPVRAAERTRSPSCSPRSASSTAGVLPRHARTPPCGRRCSLIVWRFAGFYMLMLLVGLQGISGDVYEAARHRRGQPRGRPSVNITLPLLQVRRSRCARSCASPARCSPSTSSTSSPRAARTTARSPSSS